MRFLHHGVGQYSVLGVPTLGTDGEGDSRGTRAPASRWILTVEPAGRPGSGGSGVPRKGLDRRDERRSSGHRGDPLGAGPPGPRRDGGEAGAAGSPRRTPHRIAKSGTASRPAGCPAAPPDSSNSPVGPPGPRRPRGGSTGGSRRRTGRSGRVDRFPAVDVEFLSMPTRRLPRPRTARFGRHGRGRSNGSDSNGAAPTGPDPTGRPPHCSNRPARRGWTTRWTRISTGSSCSPRRIAGGDRHGSSVGSPDSDCRSPGPRPWWSWPRWWWAGPSGSTSPVACGWTRRSACPRPGCPMEP